ncbi:MAG: hypothetical protein O3A01_08395 [bacterium]|nr:hypothetical protein [bacterium]
MNTNNSINTASAQAMLASAASAPASTNEDGGQSFQEELNYQQVKEANKENYQKIAVFGFKSMQMIEPMNNYADIGNVDQTLTQLENDALSLRESIGEEGLININEVEDVQPFVEKMSDKGKRFAQIAFTVNSAMPHLNGVEEEKVATVSRAIDKLNATLDKLNGELSSAMNLKEGFSNLNFLGLGLNGNTLNNPELLGLQVQQNLASSLISAINNSDNDDDNDDNSFLGNLSGASGTVNPLGFNQAQSLLNPTGAGNTTVDPNGLISGISQNSLNQTAGISQTNSAGLADLIQPN